MPGSIDRVAAIVLAAGHGLRMRSPRPKVLHRVGGRPLIGHVLETLAGVPGLGPRVVVTSGHPGIAEAVAVGGSAERVSLVVQDPPRGTADAARVGLEHLRGSCDLVLITYGDAPLVRAETFEALLREHSARDAAATLVTARANDPSGYGRVLRDPRGYVRAVVEHRDADDEQRLVDEINGGVYVFDPARLAVAIDKVRANNDQDEYYLTDVVEILYSSGDMIASLETDAREVAGVNSKADLATVGAVLRARICEHWLEQGVTIVDPTTTYIDATVTLEPEAVIQPFTFLEGTTSVARGAQVGPQTRIVSSEVGADATVSFSVVVESSLGPESQVGPFASLRPGTRLERRAKVGTFVETKKTTVGEASKAPHLSYLGDTEIGRRVNIGAGTITCNYDGRTRKKYGTVIEDDAFIGSDTMLVAPARVGKGASTGAGAVVRGEVPDGALAVGVPARIVDQRARPDNDETEDKGDSEEAD